MKHYTHMTYEIKNEDSKLYENNLTSNDKLFIEKGRPLKKDEVPLKFMFLQYSKEGNEFTELFTLPLKLNLSIKEAKVEIIDYFKKI